MGDALSYTLVPVGGHTPRHLTDLAIYFARTEASPPVLMVVDVVFPGWAPFSRLALSPDIFQYVQTHERLLNDFDLGDDGIFVAGHLSRLGNRDDIALNYELTSAVLDAAGVALSEVFPDPVGTGFGDPTHPGYNNVWNFFDDYLARVRQHCARAVVAEFGCKMAGVDVFADSFCDVAQSYLRIDF